jgi:hypothetical protein
MPSDNDELFKKFEDLLVKSLADQETKLVARFEKIVKPLEIQVKVLTAKLANSAVTREDTLTKVPKQDGELPSADFPGTLMELVVSGSESLPNGKSNPWNRKKSIRLLREYGQDAGEASDADETEDSTKSRAARLKLARVLGISTVQLNYACT